SERRRCPSLFKPQLGIPKLQVFIDIAGEDQHAFAAERPVVVVGRGGRHIGLAPELVDGDLLVLVAGAEPDRREVGLINAVGIMLSFQTESAAMNIALAVLAGLAK